jgi:hypothetical protein
MSSRDIIERLTELAVLCGKGDYDSLTASDAAAEIARLRAARDEAVRHWRKSATDAVNYCTRATAAESRLASARKVIEDLATADALFGVRDLVAGWNGEGNPDGPYSRHPPRLGATLPKTNCGAVYKLDEALSRARSWLQENGDE